MFKKAAFMPSKDNFRTGLLVLLFDLQEGTFSEVNIFKVTMAFDGKVTYHLLENCVFNAFNQGFNTFSVDSLLFV